jgi:ketosteroid isomerase-like protein
VTVSEEDLTVVRRAFDSFNEIGADIDAPFEAPAAVFDDDPEIVPFRAALEDTMYSGSSAFDDFWDDSRESWSELHVELESIEPVGEGVLAVGRLIGTSRDAGAHVESRIAFACHLRDGLVWRLASHLSEESARRELGAD